MAPNFLFIFFPFLQLSTLRRSFLAGIHKTIRKKNEAFVAEESNTMVDQILVNPTLLQSSFWSLLLIWTERTINNHIRCLSSDRFTIYYCVKSRADLLRIIKSISVPESFNQCCVATSNDEIYLEFRGPITTPPFFIKKLLCTP
jgi:hypothetical protein